MGVYKSSSTLGFGSIVITIGIAPSAVTYILESWTPVAPVEMAERKDNLNQPNGFVQSDQARTASAVAQLATATTPRPGRGAEFTTEETGDDGQPETVTWVIGEVTAPKEQNGIWKCSFNAREKV